VHSDFYEIPLPALRFEKTEEIDIKETTPKEMTLSKETTHRKTMSKPERKMTLTSSQASARI
jgi:hypothetical protein